MSGLLSPLQQATTLIRDAANGGYKVTTAPVETAPTFVADSSAPNPFYAGLAGIFGAATKTIELATPQIVADALGFSGYDTKSTSRANDKELLNATGSADAARGIKYDPAIMLGAGALGVAALFLILKK